MASSIVFSFRPTGIRPCASYDGDRRSDDGRGRRSPSGNWWTPLFGWSPDPDYIDGPAPEKVDEDRRPARGGVRFAAFTEEKARELRMRTKETESFHDTMYHSAIASRLASDLSRRSDC